jgi:plasmid maintenance system antidote protein VapI
MALRIEKAFGVKMDTLLRMQTAYEIADARDREGEVTVKRYMAKVRLAPRRMPTETEPRRPSCWRSPKPG